MLFAPGGECCLFWLGEKWQGASCLGSREGVQFVGMVGIPYAFGLAIIKQKCVSVRIACRAKGGDLTVDFASVDYGQLYERSPANRDWLAANGVID